MKYRQGTVWTIAARQQEKHLVSYDKTGKRGIVMELIFTRLRSL
ncbi:MAG: hypothetical protein OEV24_16710 [Cyclobacteriaceae bacterium]|nr:hypothetical protein [Cyclobacteriaceae bacterium]MDH5248461.1 hypothetical protein [Cyclobacteriaceae bacterium]